MLVVQMRRAVVDNPKLVRCAVIALREPTHDPQSLLPRLGLALGARAVVAARRRGRQFYADAAWRTDGGWTDETTTVPASGAVPLDQESSEFVVCQAAAAVGAPAQATWTVARAL